MSHLILTSFHSKLEVDIQELMNANIPSRVKNTKDGQGPNFNNLWYIKIHEYNFTPI